MSKKRLILSKTEMYEIEDRESKIDLVTETLRLMPKFKCGDFLIAFEVDRDDESLESRDWVFDYSESDVRAKQVLNSYGVPKKFKVVYVDKHQIPYLKEIDLKGRPHGKIRSPVEFHHDNDIRSLDENEYRFEVDPDYTDSIILDDEESYRAVETHQIKHKLRKEIVAHNKLLKAQPMTLSQCKKFIKSLQAGDVLWKSIQTNFTILRVGPIPSPTYLTAYGDDTFIDVKDSNGKTRSLGIHDFMKRTLYTGQPRSFKELERI